MNNNEIVDSFLQKRKEKFKKFIISQAIIDVIEISVLVFAVLKFMDTEYLIYVCYGIAAIMFITASINMRIHFGPSKGPKSESQIGVIYKKEKAKLDNAQKEHKRGKIDELTLLEAQKAFEQAIEEIAEKIKLFQEDRP